MLVFAGACLLVSRLIARQVSYEFLLFVRMSAKMFVVFSLGSCR